MNSIDVEIVDNYPFVYFIDKSNINSNQDEKIIAEILLDGSILFKVSLSNEIIERILFLKNEYDLKTNEEIEEEKRRFEIYSEELQKYEFLDLMIHYLHSKTSRKDGFDKLPENIKNQLRELHLILHDEIHFLISDSFNEKFF